MLTLKVSDRRLENELKRLLQHEFEGNADKMLQELLASYAARLERLEYSGILKWGQDGVAYQKEIRDISWLGRARWREGGRRRRG